jgi:hypothetical protein
MKNENKKQFKATLNIEVYFNDTDLTQCKDLCELKLRAMLRMVENTFDKEGIGFLTQSYDIKEDNDDLHIWTEKVKKNEQNLGCSDDMKISEEITCMLIEALSERFNKNFENGKAQKENNEILNIIRNLINED